MNASKHFGACCRADRTGACVLRAFAALTRGCSISDDKKRPAAAVLSEFTASVDKGGVGDAVKPGV